MQCPASQRAAGRASFSFWIRLLPPPCDQTMALPFERAGANTAKEGMAIFATAPFIDLLSTRWVATA